jgi:hypothetical protein
MKIVAAIASTKIQTGRKSITSIGIALTLLQNARLQ